METVTHDGRETAYRIVSSDAGGRTTLYVHGSGGTHRVWGNQYARVGPSHPAVALDLSDHGASADFGTDDGSAMRHYAEDVFAVATAVDADVLVGSSLGGAVVQTLVLEHDWEPDALVLVGTGARLPVFDGLREWLSTDFERAVEFLHGRDRLFHDVDPAVAEKSREQMYAVGQRVTRRDFLACDRFDVSERLGEIEVPVLAVCGEHDKLTPRSAHEQLAAGVQNGEFTFVPDAAHLAMIEQSTIFNEIVAGFLDTVV